MFAVTKLIFFISTDIPPFPDTLQDFEYYFNEGIYTYIDLITPTDSCKSY